MPELPQAVTGTWAEKQYLQDGKPEAMAAALNGVSEFSNSRQAPVFCGEFGVYMINSLPDDRLRWHTVAARFLDERGIARTSWDYFGGFGLFKTPSGGSFYADLNIDIVKALGFTPPEQTGAATIRSGFALYDDYLRNGASIANWGTGGGISFSVYGDGAAEGAYCLVWKNPRQYNAISFNFAKDIDWAYLKDKGYALRFKMKTDGAASFDIRFMNSEDTTSIPWRMRFTVKTDAESAGDWSAVTIPLSGMAEHGAWINAAQKWRSPQGLFSWENIETLQFVAEAGDIAGFLRFDSIEVALP
jgi:endoglucanase